jgi:hypothetical protein
MLMADPPARRRLVNDAVGGLISFLIEVGIVLGFAVLAAIVAAVTLLLV